jgi:multidrug efflux pump subunit AcrA (membrane-fusion protein)
VESAQQALADTELIAPIDGTVMTIASSVGEQVSSGFITLADLAQPMLEIYLDETDLDKIGVDYEVEVYFDALPDDVFTGHVVQVDPQLSVVSNVTTVRALVQLDTDSFAKPQNLPVGMNATVDVIGGRADNALLVPVEALRELSTDEYAVFVMENSEPVLRFVEVGIMDFTYAEILSGLEQGETVTTGIVETE